ATTLDARVRLLSPDIVMTPELRRFLTGWVGCGNSPCALLRLDDHRLLLVKTIDPDHEKRVDVSVVDLNKLKKGGDDVADLQSAADASPAATLTGVDMSRATVE